MNSDFIELYTKRFVGAYSDLVALTGVKQEQTLIEQENILGHLIQSENPSLDPDKRKENIDKAKNHLIRLCIDTHKLLWAEIRKELDDVVHSGWKRICFQVSEGEVLEKYSLFIQAGREARRHEMEQVGVNPISSLDKYEKAIDIGRNLLSSLDELKIKKMSRLVKVVNSKEFLLGILAGVLGSAIFSGIGYLIASLANN